VLLDWRELPPDGSWAELAAREGAEAIDAAVMAAHVTVQDPREQAPERPTPDPSPSEPPTGRRSRVSSGQHERAQPDRPKPRRGGRVRP
jgi:hypothetical protein